MKSRLYLGCLIVAGAVLGSAGAYATTESGACSVSGVAFDSSARLVVDCGKTHYYGFDTNWKGCTRTTSMDVLRTWESMAATALLSGKKLKIGWDTQGGSGCGATGARAISHIWLVQ